MQPHRGVGVYIYIDTVWNNLAVLWYILRHWICKRINGEFLVFTKTEKYNIIYNIHVTHKMCWRDFTDICALDTTIFQDCYMDVWRFFIRTVDVHVSVFIVTVDTVFNDGSYYYYYYYIDAFAEVRIFI